MRVIVSQPVDTHSQEDVECYESAVEPGKYEYGDYFEGDMELDEDQLAAIQGERNVMKNKEYRWPNAITQMVVSQRLYS